MPDDLFSLKNDYLAALDPVPLTDKDPDDFSVIIEGVDTRVISGRVRRAMDTVVDAWSAIVRWDPSNEAHQDLFRPFGYQKSECYLGQDIAISGLLMENTSKGSTEGTFKALEGFSLPVDCIDDNVDKPFEQVKVSLEERARTLTANYPFKVVFDAGISDELFDRVTAEPDDKLFAHLTKLAKQRGVLVTSSKFGELKFIRANTTGAPVDTVQDNFPPGTEYEIKFSGRKRFYETRARAQTPGRRRKKKAPTRTASAFDTAVPVHRMRSFSADETTVGNLQQAADWERSQSFAEALSIPYPVTGWYTSKGKLWEENTIVTVESEVLHLPDGYNFLIREVEYLFSDKGTSAILSLVPPEVYTGGEIADPWAG